MTIHRLCPLLATGILAAACALAAPASAQDPMPPLLPPTEQAREAETPGAGYPAAQLPLPPAYSQARYEEDRARWLDDCRRRYRDNGLGGALIGGAIGGFMGNRIAGKGSRTAGTIAGAAAGAAAGYAIDKAEDGERVRDVCEAYLDQHSSVYPAVPDQFPGYAYAYDHLPPGPGHPAAYYPTQYPAFPAGSLISTGPCGYGAVAYIYVPTWVPVSTRRAKRVLGREVGDTAHEDEAAPMADKRIKIIPDK